MEKQKVQKKETLAILFADIANSTRLYESLGNDTARCLIGNCLSLLSEVTVGHQGTVIKTIGDEIMCTFPGIDNAVSAAIEMNRNLVEMPVENKPGVSPPNIYVGIQLGPVITEDNDVFGDAVNIAARMVELAKQRQIMTTEETVSAMHPRLKSTARYAYKTTIRGKTGEVGIYEIMWEQKDETIMLDASLDSLTLEACLELRLGDKIFEVGKNRPSVTLGRQSHNDIVINDIRVSRTHACIEYRRGKFVLVDQSTNGTYALIYGEKAIRLRRDEAPLHGTGLISLGRKVERETSGKIPLIYFEIKLA